MYCFFLKLYMKSRAQILKKILQHKRQENAEGKRLRRLEIVDNV